MRSLDILQNLLQDESRRREQIRAHLRAALALLDTAEQSPAAAIPQVPAIATPPSAPGPLAPAPGTPIPTQSALAPAAQVAREKRQYIERMVAILARTGRPLGPAELRNEVCKDVPTTTREALERAIWLELRKNNPRLARLGEGKYGLPEWRYKWITEGTTS